MLFGAPLCHAVKIDPRILDGKFLHILFPARPDRDSPGWSLILLDGSEIPNNHPGCMKPSKKWDKKLPYQLVVGDF